MVMWQLQQECELGFACTPRLRDTCGAPFGRQVGVAAREKTIGGDGSGGRKTKGGLGQGPTHSQRRSPGSFRSRLKRCNCSSASSPP
eukprot:87554-Pyramimonas_sp.AAC.1